MQIHEQYKGYKIVTFASGDGRFILFNTLGHKVVETFHTIEAAKAFIDKCGIKHNV